MNVPDYRRDDGIGGLARGREHAAGSSTFALGIRIASHCACVAACALAAQGLALANTTPQSAVASASPADRLAASREAALRRPVRVTDKARNYYVTRWGVDKLRVSSTSSGNLIRFSYRVADPQLATVLADKGATPYLLGQRSRAVLQVPVMDKVGALRQSSTPEPGREYWMVFSNKGNLVRPGDRVNVMIGQFHADGLLVE